jgi:hypothetical protein
MYPRNLLYCAAIATFLAQRPAQSQDLEPAAKATVSENATKAAKFAATEALRYEISHADKPKEKFKLLPQPVLRWSNPTQGEVYGSVVFWTNHGCPEAAASIYQFFHRKQLNIELVSLSEAPFSAQRNDRLRWSPEAGVKFAPIPDAPPAADSVKKRQLQTRSLARKFSGSLAARDEETKLSALRLMAKPLYEYESSDRSNRDGAVFAFVTTTDPEILLIIESRLKGSEREWVFAAARMHYCRLQL